MKISTNKAELIDLGACEDGFGVFIEAHGDKDATFSQCLDSNGWDDVRWLIGKVYDQLSDSQKYDLRVFGCNAALINIEKIKPYCSDKDYELIVDYLKNPTESARSAARSAAWAAWAAAESVESAAWAAAESVESAAWAAAESAAESAAWAAAESAAESAAMKKFNEQLRELFVKWEQGQ